MAEMAHINSNRNNNTLRIFPAAGRAWSPRALTENFLGMIELKRSHFLRAKKRLGAGGGGYMRYGFRRAILFAGLALVASITSSVAADTPATAPHTTAATPSGPVSCTIGAFVQSLDDVDNAAGTFKADLWMWSVCPTKDNEPLKTMEFTNAVDVTGDLDATLQRGDKWWAVRKVRGTFRQDFSLQNYPFDHEPLVITMEEAVLDVRDLVYSADATNSAVDPTVHLPGWILGDFTITSGTITHPTNYGDPSLAPGESAYASLQLSLGAERAHWSNFAKVTLPIYIVAILVLVSLLFDVAENDMFLGRMGVLGTAMFAIVLSFLSVDTIVGQHEGMFLLDQLHMVALFLIVAATGWGVFAHVAIRRGTDAAVIQHWDGRVTIVLLTLFVLVNIICVTMAIQA